MFLVKNPDSIVRVKNNMTGEDSHFMYESTDGLRRYHIPAGKVREMRWRDYLEIQQYEGARKYLTLAEETSITEDGEVFLYDTKSSELIPYENIHELLALPESSVASAIKEMSKANLLRVREIAEEENRESVVTAIDDIVKKRGGRPKSQKSQE